MPLIDKSIKGFCKKFEPLEDDSVSIHIRVKPEDVDIVNIAGFHRKDVLIIFPTPALSLKDEVSPAIEGILMNLDPDHLYSEGIQDIQRGLAKLAQYKSAVPALLCGSRSIPVTFPEISGEGGVDPAAAVGDLFEAMDITKKEGE